MLVCSRACVYAIRALARLAAQSPSNPLKARDIAAQENIPSAFLAKVLHQLVKAGLVSSSPGLTGGFRLRVPASRLTLLEIVAAIDGLAQFSQCFTGLGECNEQAPCPMHESWKKVRSSIEAYLRETTLGQVAEAWASKGGQTPAALGATALRAAAGTSWTETGLPNGLASAEEDLTENGEGFSDFQWPID